MESRLFRLIARFARYGVLHREVLKNDPKALGKLLRKGWVRKVYKQGRVYYELTPKALPLLELRRQELLLELQMRASLEPRHPVFSALLNDLRFLDERRPEAQEFFFLADWQLRRPVAPSQLELSKLRFYSHVVIPRHHQRKAA